jgi:hypothetical protein
MVVIYVCRYVYTDTELSNPPFPLLFMNCLSCRVKACKKNSKIIKQSLSMRGVIYSFGQNKCGQVGGEKEAKEPVKVQGQCSLSRPRRTLPPHAIQDQ